MPLTPGTTLGPYRVVAPLGEGGMGEVYLAHDDRLDREVAVKVMPAEVTGEVDRVARFRREARMVASLNHPNIASIYDVEEVGDGTIALVLELVPGRTLADRIAEGPLACADALPIARQIADALEAAHGQGIIHRDLKPANIKVREDGAVKVLDFGIAKAVDTPSRHEASHTRQGSNDATMTTPAATAIGLILGTAAYMSPEQARGKPIDARADIWAYGCVLHEMLTGRPTFGDEDVTLTLSNVVRREPDLDAMPADVPAGVRQAVRLCLQKDPRQRLQAIGDVRLALEGAFSTEMPGTAAGVAPSGTSGWRRRMRWLAAGAAGLMLGWLAGSAGPLGRVGGPADLRVSVALPDPLGIPTLYYNESSSLATIAISHDGTQFAYVGYENGTGHIYLRGLDSFEAVRLPNSDGGFGPFFSPDGGSLAFFARGRLWRVDLPGGVPIDLAAAGSAEGGTWDAGSLFYTPSFADPIWRIPAAGGTPEPLTTIDRAAGEVSHRWPHALPDGAGVLFTIKRATDATMDDGRIAIADLETGRHRVVVEGGTSPRYLESGHLVFARDGQLFAVPFDLSSGTVRGSPTQVLDGVSTGPYTGAAFYDVTRAGALAFVPGGPLRGNTRLAWAGPGGPDQVLDRLTDSPLNSPRLAPDSRRAAVQVAGANDKLWLVDLDRMTLSRLTSGPGNDWGGLFSADGRWILFSSDRDGGTSRIYRMPLDGSAPPSSLDITGRTSSMADSGRLLAFTGPSAAGSDLDAYVLTLADDGTASGQPVLVAGGQDNQTLPAVSADGALVAYESDESGESEVYVTNRVERGRPRRLTTGGGTSPQWSPDGRRLFYIGQGAVFAVTLESASDLAFSAPVRIADASAFDSFDVGRDGRVLITRLDDPLELRREIRFWPGWGDTVRAGR